jgi:hypothetical protein
MTKWIMGIAVVAVVAGGVYWYMVIRPGSPVATNNQLATSTPQMQNGMSAPNDSSNQALMQDSAAIDSQMQGLSQDSAAADASLSDQAVQQTY